MAEIHGKNIIKNGLVLHLDAANPQSYDGNSNIWRDLSGNGNNGTLINGPTYNNTNKGSIVFDGVNDYVDCGNVKPTVAITVNIWIYFNNSFGSGNRYVSDWHQIPNEDRWLFYTTGTNQICWYMHTIGQSDGATNSYTVQLNKWINLCGTYDSNISGGISAQKFYVNGVLFHSVNRISTLNVGSVSKTVKFGGQVTAGGYFNGKVGITQIYNKSLSSNEILQNYNATKNRFGI